METTPRTSTPLTAILAMLLTLAVVGGLYLDKTRTLIDRFDQEERRADSLLSVKLQLEGDVRSLTSQLEMATGENESLGKRISALHGQLYQRDALENQLRQQNGVRTRAIQGLNVKVENLKTARDSSEKQMEAMRDKIEWMAGSNALLANQNKELQRQLNDAQATILTKVSRSTITGDAFLVETTKANQKETAKAKKVKALTVSLRIPTDLKLNGAQDVYLSLTDSQNNPIITTLKTTTITLADINEVIPVHAIQRINFSPTTQRISLSIIPDHTLKPGKYRASVYTRDIYLGAVEFQLRDSFWFF